jgi:hypothetical protein
MTTDSVTLAAVRAHLRASFNEAVRRPGMFGGEMTLRLYLDALDVAHGHERASAEIVGLRARGAFSPLGVPGAFRTVLPGLEASRPAALNAGLDHLMASVYAEIGHHQGWLELDRTLTDRELATIEEKIRDGWCATDRTATQVTEAFGPPSVLIGGTGPAWPRTLVYSAAGSCLSFHLWNSFTAIGPRDDRTEYPEPMLIAVRREGQPFAHTFLFTPIGEGLRSEKRRP